MLVVLILTHALVVNLDTIYLQELVSNVKLLSQDVVYATLPHAYSVKAAILLTQHQIFANHAV